MKHYILTENDAKFLNNLADEISIFAISKVTVMMTDEEIKAVRQKNNLHNYYIELLLSAKKGLPVKSQWMSKYGPCSLEYLYKQFHIQSLEKEMQIFAIFMSKVLQAESREESFSILIKKIETSKEIGF